MRELVVHVAALRRQIESGVESRFRRADFRVRRSSLTFGGHHIVTALQQSRGERERYGRRHEYIVLARLNGETAGGNADQHGEGVLELLALGLCRL